MTPVQPLPKNCIRFIPLSICILITGLCSAVSFANSTPQPAISIIIDDIGNELQAGLRAVRLPGPITFAVLPQSPYGQKLAVAAYKSNKEVMLHMPMDNRHGAPIGPSGLTTAQGQAEFIRTLESAIAWVPHVSGLNNHTGSQLTQNTTKMQWLMRSVKRYPLYFVDSRTTAETVAERTARAHGIPTLRRDVFLDHDQATAAIHEQFIRLLALAKKKGTALAIGHPHPATLAYLEIVLPQLDMLGFRLVAPSALLELSAARNHDSEDQPTNHWVSRPAKETRPTSPHCKQQARLHIMRVTCG